jgi:hypothetical protein
LGRGVGRIGGRPAGRGGNWIDPLLTAFFCVLTRIIDWYHASEHLWDCAKAAYGAGAVQAAQWAEQLEALLWDGQVQRVIAELSHKPKSWARPWTPTPGQPAEGAGNQRHVLHHAPAPHESSGVSQTRLADRLG